MRCARFLKLHETFVGRGKERTPQQSLFENRLVASLDHLVVGDFLDCGEPHSHGARLRTPVRLDHVR